MPVKRKGSLWLLADVFGRESHRNLTRPEGFLTKQKQGTGCALPGQNQTEFNHEDHEGHEVFYSSWSSWLSIFLPQKSRIEQQRY
jgi:hypothetical protein